MKRPDPIKSASRDPGPMARLEARIADPDTPGAILQLCAAGYRIGQIARQWGVPKGRFIDWVAGKAGLHLQCRRVWQLYAITLLGKARQIGDVATPYNFFAARQQVYLLLRRASAYHAMAKKRLRDYTDEELQAILEEGRRTLLEQPNTRPAISGALPDSTNSDGEKQE